MSVLTPTVTPPPSFCILLSSCALVRLTQNFTVYMYTSLLFTKSLSEATNNIIHHFSKMNSVLVSLLACVVFAAARSRDFEPYHNGWSGYPVYHGNPHNHEYDYRQFGGYPVHVGNGQFYFLGIYQGKNGHFCLFHEVVTVWRPPNLKKRRTKSYRPNCECTVFRTLYKNNINVVPISTTASHVYDLNCQLLKVSRGIMSSRSIHL